MSSPWRLSSFSLSNPLARAYLLATLVQGLLEALPRACRPSIVDTVQLQAIRVEPGVPLEGEFDLLDAFLGVRGRRPS